MYFFAAGNFPMMQNPKAETAMARKMRKRYGPYCRLVSFYYRGKAESVMQVKQENFAEGDILIVDSGAYSAFMKGTTLDRDEYIDFVKQNINFFDYCVNLDVIGNGERYYENYLYMTSAGLDPIPVWHVETDLRFLEAYLSEAEYIGIGVRGKNQTSENIAELDSIWENYLTEGKGFPKAKFHLLGVSSAQTISKYPWYSADGTSWAKAAWKGSIVVPRTLAGIIRYDQTPLTVPVTQRLLDKSGHLANRDPKEREYIYSQINSKIVQFNLDPDLSNATTRDTINLSFYLDMAESQPEYPWAYRRNLTSIYRQMEDDTRRYSRMIRPA
jgi:hypothetical protein